MLYGYWFHLFPWQPGTPAESFDKPQFLSFWEPCNSVISKGTLLIPTLWQVSNCSWFLNNGIRSDFLIVLASLNVFSYSVICLKNRSLKEGIWHFEGVVVLHLVNIVNVNLISLLLASFSLFVPLSIQSLALCVSILFYIMSVGHMRERSTWID